MPDNRLTAAHLQVHSTRRDSYLHSGNFFTMILYSLHVVAGKIKRARFGINRFNLHTFTRLLKRCDRVILLAVSIAILIGTGMGSAWADNECGEGEQSGTLTEIVCTPSNYDPSTDGNISYVLGADDPEKSYTVAVVNLSGERAITLNNDLDSPYYVSSQPSAVWISYAGFSDFTVNVSGIELKTGFTEETATSADGNDHSGINVWMGTSNALQYSAARDIALNIRDSEFHTYSRAITAANFWNGDIDIDVRNAIIQTYGPLGIGIYGYHRAIGNIDIYVENVNLITADSDGITGTVNDTDGENPDRYSGPATIRINVKDSRIRVAGANSAGLYASHYGSGEVVLTLNDSSIEATDGATGIWIQHTGETNETENMNIFVNVNNSEITTVDKDGIAILRHSGSTGTNIITIVSSVIAGGRGFGVTAKGNTVIAIKGLLSAESGNAVQNAGGDLTLRIQDSGQVDGLVTNEAGHDLNIWVGDDLVVRNGEIIQRTGAAGAFDTTVVGTAAGFRLDREFAPRAAVYETIAGTLLRLGGQRKSVGERVRSAESPLWVSVAGAKGSYKPGRSAVGAEYDFNRYELETGLDFGLSDALIGSISMRMVWGSSDVSAPTGGGMIDVMGYGLAAGLAWHGAGGFYGMGRLSATWFDMNLHSDTRGTLKAGVDALVHTLDLEAGQRLAVGGKTALTLRAWLTRSHLSMDSFTDAIGAKVSIEDADLLKGGIGGALETELGRNTEEEELSLRVSADMERRLSGGDSTVLVSGEQLKSTGHDNRLLLGLGLTKRWGKSTFGVNLQADGLGSKDHEFAGNVSLQIPF